MLKYTWPPFKALSCGGKLLHHTTPHHTTPHHTTPHHTTPHHTTPHHTTPHHTTPPIHSHTILCTLTLVGVSMDAAASGAYLSPGSLSSKVGRKPGHRERILAYSTVGYGITLLLLSFFLHHFALLFSLCLFLLHLEMKILLQIMV